MAIQGTQIPMYTKHTVFVFFLFFNLKKKQKKQNWKQSNKNMLNKVKYKTRCKCIRREERRSRSTHRDNTNVLTKEFETFTVKRFGKQVSLLIISVNELKSESTSSTSFLMKWCWISMCLVLECWTGFLKMLMALVLSQ